MNNYIPYNDRDKQNPNSNFHEQLDIPTYQAYKQASSDRTKKVFAWLKDEWLLVFGAIFLIIGIARLVSYVEISKEIRIISGIISSIVIILFATLYYSKQKIQSAILLSLGSAIYLVSIYYSQSTIKSSAVFFLLLALLAPVYSCAVAIIKKDRIIFFSSQIFFAIVPLIPDTIKNSLNHQLLMLYYLVFLSVFILILLTKYKYIESLIFQQLIVGVYCYLFVINTSNLGIKNTTNFYTVSAFSLITISLLLTLTSIYIMKSAIENSQNVNILVALNRIFYFFMFGLFTEAVLSLNGCLTIFIIDFFLFTLVVLLINKKISQAELVLMAIQLIIIYQKLNVNIPFSLVLLFVGLALLTFRYKTAQDYKVVHEKRGILLIPVFLALFTVTNLLEFISNFGFSVLCVATSSVSCVKIDYISVISSYTTLVIESVFFLTFLIIYFVIPNLKLKVPDKKIFDTSKRDSLIVSNTFLGMLIWTFSRLFIENKSLSLVFSIILYTLLALGFYIVRNKKIEYRIISFVYMVILLVRMLLIEFKNLSKQGRMIVFISLGLLFILTGLISKLTDPKLEKESVEQK